MKSRRAFLKTSLTVCAAAGLSSVLRCTGGKKPNVLMIIADDMNDYGFHKTYPVLKTPYLDQFSKSAIRFERGYCAAPACVPSRAAVFSGIFPHKSGAYQNGCDPWNQAPFTEIESMPECFQRNGYTTFGRGKLFHSQPPKARRDAMWDNKVWGGGFGPFPDKAHQLKGKFWGVQAFEDDEFPDVKNGEALIDFLNQEHDAPFFAVYGLWRPHTPFTAPQRFYDMYDPAEMPIPLEGWTEDDLDDVPPLGKKLAEVWGDRFDLCGNENPDLWRKFVHAYCACTSFADWSIGRVIEALDKSSHADNTLVVFWSDNGYHCGEKDHWEKTTLWEQSALTPMAVRLPDRKNGGASCKRTVNTLDWYPTLIDFCRIQGPAHQLDGRNLKPLLYDPKSEWKHPSVTTYGDGYFSVRDEQYRYISYPDGAEELYDHETDPHELDNRADDPALTAVKEALSRHQPETMAKSLGGRLG